MRRFVTFALVIGGTVYLQHGLGPHLAPWGINPDLTLVLIVYLALNWGGFAGAVAGFCLGFASDVLSWGVIGVGALAGTVAGGLVGAYRGNIYERSIVAPPVLTGLATVFKEGVNLAVLVIVAGAVTVGGYHFLRLLLVVVINSVVAVPLFLFYWWIIPPADGAK
ncbi:MAG: rod shape-determining protein MreD [Candidatus Coatesbacteria bacterium]|nr:MAG: rod shape-determining protein MreD [Candidatus Coatesbacteria bacterium]